MKRERIKLFPKKEFSYSFVCTNVFILHQSESASSGDEMSMYHNRDARVVTQRGPLLSWTTYAISLRK